MASNAWLQKYLSSAQDRKKTYSLLSNSCFIFWKSTHTPQHPHSQNGIDTEQRGSCKGQQINVTPIRRLTCRREQHHWGRLACYIYTTAKRFVINHVWIPPGNSPHTNKLLAEIIKTINIEQRLILQATMVAITQMVDCYQSISLYNLFTVSLQHKYFL